MKYLSQITTSVLISFCVALLLSMLLCGSVAYAWVSKTREDWAAQTRVQQYAQQQAQRQEIERVKAAAEERIAAEVARREMAQQSPLAAHGIDTPIRKDEAWSNWYQPPEQCGMNVAEADFVYCVNHKMLARKEFERVWQQGLN